MPATIIDGKAVAASVREEVARDVAAFRDRTGQVPGLATILVGDDPASSIYVANKRKASTEAGIADLGQDHLALPQFQQRGRFHRAFQVQVQLRLRQGENKGTGRGQFVVESDLLAGAHTRFDLANSL